MNIARKIFSYIGLIAIIPALVGLYLAFYPAAAVSTNEKKTIIIITSLLVSLGIVALVRLVMYLSRISASLVTMSKGNYDQKIESPAPSGMEAQFADSINEISRRLRESADELERRALLIERSNQELKRLSEVKLQFLSEVAHELRTPLINIEKSSTLLLDTDAVADLQQKQFLRVITENSRRMMRLINELLDMSKLEAGTVLLKRENMEIISLLTEAAASVERWRQSKNIVLDVRVEGVVPKVYADKDKIVQVIINLLSNSIKFTPGGGRIALEARLYNGPISFDRPHVEVCVKDNGKGIAEERMATIFDKYKSVETSETDSGTGLGLPIAKQLVDIHGGIIWAESRPGKGSSFTFTVPAPPADMAKR